MYSPDNYLNQINITPESKAEQELNVEQKESLSSVWSELIVDGATIPENIGEMNKDEIRNWLSESLAKDTDKLCEEFNLKADVDLAEKIKNEHDPEAKSALELEFIQNAHRQVNALIKNFDRSGSKTTKWDSFPKRMRETKEFNCVGATLLGSNLLEKGGVRSYYGNPSGHALSIVKLANDEWWYVDFRNGERDVLKIEPEEIVLDGINILKINNLEIDYKLIPIFKNSVAPALIISNLTAIKNDAENVNSEEASTADLEAKEYFEKNKQSYKENDFELLHDSLYPEMNTLSETKEMINESERLDFVRKFDDGANEYIQSLTKEQELELVEEIKNKRLEIESFLLRDDASVLQDAGPEIKKILNLYDVSRKEMESKHPEIYQEIVDKMISRIRRL